jgi:tetratricopeptide (TPR) repeat protein
MTKPTHEEAERIYQQAFDLVQEQRILEAEGLFPDHRHRHLTLLNRAGKQELKKARNLLEECLDLDPNFVLAHKELAVVLRKLGDNEGVLQHRRIVKRLMPEDIVNRYNLAKVLNDTGRYKEALQEAEELAIFQPNDAKIRHLLEKLQSKPPVQFGRLLRIIIFENLMAFVFLIILVFVCYWLANILM